LTLLVWLALTCRREIRAGEETAPPDETTVATFSRIEVFPTQVKLDTARRRMHLIVSGYDTQGRVYDLTHKAAFTPADSSPVSVDDAMLRPLANGKTQITVQAGDQTATVAVEVTGQQKPDPVSFRYGTLVVLTKYGCNSGACHGAPSGKGGFRLSLRAYDPVLDTETLTREMFSRRIDPLEPEASLLLRKPTMQVAHGGGRRLVREDPGYELLRDWIAEGLRGDPADAPQCSGIEVFPAKRTLYGPHRGQQLLVLAHFSDGSTRDITRLASFSSSDEAVASVDPRGLVTGQEQGEAAVLVRYLAKMATSRMTFLKDAAPFEWPNPPVNNHVDELVLEKLKRLQIEPSGLCTDDEFIRRVYLDVLGILPDVAETQAFLADGSPEKRSQLIEHLFERPEYAQFWALRWGDLLRLNPKNVTTSGVHKLNRWLVTSLRDNMPYDRFVATLLTASGGSFENPTANYYRTAADTNDCTETTAQLFMGIRIQCAKCHNHPFESWTQDNYYGIGAWFTRVRRKPGIQPDEIFVWTARDGEVTQPRTGQRMRPWLPLKNEVDVPADVDRREVFAAWLTSPDNPFFAKAEVNRMWGYLIGRGIVEPVDDFRASNPPSNDALLDWLAEDFAQHGFDRKHLMATILKSRTYQASSRTTDLNRRDVKYFSHARTRLLSAEQLLDAICKVTDVPEKYAGLPLGTLATELPGPEKGNAFLKVFGQPAREMACQCERSNESNLSQALQMINGPLVHGKLTHADNRFRRLAKNNATDEAIIRQLYFSALCRPPGNDELQAGLAHIAAQPDRLLALEDVCWAILNSKEFLFQH